MTNVSLRGSGIPTLDASNLSYQVERVRISYPNIDSTSKLLKTITEESGKAIPQSLSYVDDFYDSGTVFQVDRTDVCSVY